MCKTAKFEGATSYKRVKIQLRKGTKFTDVCMVEGTNLPCQKLKKKIVERSIPSITDRNTFSKYAD